MVVTGLVARHLEEAVTACTMKFKAGGRNTQEAPDIHVALSVTKRSRKRLFVPAPIK